MTTLYQTKTTVAEWYGSSVTIPQISSNKFIPFASSCMGVAISLLDKKTNKKINVGLSSAIDTAYADPNSELIVISEKFMRGDFSAIGASGALNAPKTVGAILGVIVHEIGHFAYSPDTLAPQIEYIEHNTKKIFNFKVARTIANTVEDIYVEYQIARLAPTLEWTLAEINRLMLTDDGLANSVRQMKTIHTPDDHVGAILNYLLFAKVTKDARRVSPFARKLFTLARSATRLESLSDRSALCLALYELIAPDKPTVKSAPIAPKSKQTPEPEPEDEDNQEETEPEETEPEDAKDPTEDEELTPNAQSEPEESDETEPENQEDEDEDNSEDEDNDYNGSEDATDDATDDLEDEDDSEDDQEESDDFNGSDEDDSEPDDQEESEPEPDEETEDDQEDDQEDEDDQNSGSEDEETEPEESEDEDDSEDDQNSGSGSEDDSEDEDADQIGDSDLGNDVDEIPQIDTFKERENSSIPEHTTVKTDLGYRPSLDGHIVIESTIKPDALNAIDMDKRYTKLSELARQRTNANVGFGQQKTRGRDLRQIYRIVTDQKVFSSRVMQETVKPMDVIILLDCSGSMSFHSLNTSGEYETKLMGASRATLGAATGLINGKCSVAVYGHTADPYSQTKQILIYNLLHNGESPKSLARRLFTLNSHSGNLFWNRDGYALYEIAKKFQSKNKKRVLIVISDGAPNGDGKGYDGMDAIDHTKDMVKSIRESGISVYSISIDKSAYQTNNYIYGKEWNTCAPDANAIDDLVRQLYK